MIFSSDKVAFGRHETFPLRYSWLTKGYQELEFNSELFTSEDSTLKLGVGKNMVNSIRYWLQAAQIIENSSKGYYSTPIGKLIFGEEGYDPYLEDEATIWLIHWLLATNPSKATTWYWFFNLYNKPEFTNAESISALQEYVEQKVKQTTAISTLTKDINVLLRMYSHQTESSSKFSEEMLDSPLSVLKLIGQSSDNKTYYSDLNDRNIPLGVIGYVITTIFDATGSKTIPIENLMYMKSEHPALGAVFRMTESDLLSKLEKLIHYIPNIFEISDSAGVHQIYRIKNINSLEYLNHHYSRLNSEVAA